MLTGLAKGTTPNWLIARAPVNEPRKAPSTDSIYNVGVAAEDGKLDSYTHTFTEICCKWFKMLFLLEDIHLRQQSKSNASSWAPAFDEDPSRVEAAKKKPAG